MLQMCVREEGNKSSCPSSIVREREREREREVPHNRTICRRAKSSLIVVLLSPDLSEETNKCLSLNTKV